MDELKVREGRNITKIEEKDQRYYFRKKIVGVKEDATRRYNNLIKWEEVKTNLKDINTPLLLKNDDTTLELTYEYLENTKSLEDIVNDKEIGYMIIKAVKILSLIHSVSIDKVILKVERSLINRKHNIMDLNKYEYASFTGAEIELFNLLQHDDTFIRRINNDTKNEDITLCHGDIRLDQFLFNDEKLWIIDFEEMCLGDPMKDLAGVIGSLYFNCLLKTFSTTTQETSNGKEVEDQFIDRGTSYIEEIVPIIKSAIIEYGKTSKVNGRQLSINIGWFFIERIMSRAKFSFRLSAVDKAILGIGREIVVSPEKLEDIFI